MSPLLSFAMLFDDLGETEASGCLEKEISGKLSFPLAGHQIWAERWAVLCLLNSFAKD